MHPPSLLAITPGDDRPLAPWIRALGDAGLPAVLIREPQLTAEALEAVVQVARAHVPTVIVHARHPRAARLGLPLHLSSTAPDPPGPPLHGRSCHSPAEVRRALAAGAAYVLLSPLWAPTSKPGDRRDPLGLAALHALPPGVRRRTLGLGGITAERHRRVVATGAAGAAVSGDLFGAASPRAAARRLTAYSLPSTGEVSASSSSDSSATGSNTNSSS